MNLMLTVTLMKGASRCRMAPSAAVVLRRNPKVQRKRRKVGKTTKIKVLSFIFPKTKMSDVDGLFNKTEVKADIFCVSVL